MLCKNTTKVCHSVTKHDVSTKKPKQVSTTATVHSRANDELS